MKIITAYLTKNPCFKRNQAQTDKRDVLFQNRGAKGLMLHSVGCAQPSAEVFCERWNKLTYTRACVHAFIDANNGIIYQTLPWNYRGWHAGKNIGNNEYIGVEMCESSHIKYVTSTKIQVLNWAKAQEECKKAYDSAVELFAYLCEKLHLDPMTDITSHVEGHEKGIASNHGDPVHYWNALKTGYTMDRFRRDVRDAMTNSFALGIKYKVVSKDGYLNVRAGAGTSYAVIGKVKAGWTVKYYGRQDGKWMYIKKPSTGVEGWVHSAYLKKGLI